MGARSQLVGLVYCSCVLFCSLLFLEFLFVACGWVVVFLFFVFLFNTIWVII